MRTISLLGSTGSIGRSTLEVVRAYPQEFSVTALAARSNVQLLLEQARRFRPKLVVVWRDEHVAELKKQLRAQRITVMSGTEGLSEAATMNGANRVVFSLSGTDGLVPLCDAIARKKTIALANKELLVIAGELIMARVRRAGVTLLPIDSEHSALFQCMEGRPHSSIRRLIITASGGPFIDTPRAAFRHITPARALRHPRWKMGAKITIDSATLMNKGLEVIEAARLYNMAPAQIDVVVHRESIVHSLVEFIDGTMLAQLSVPDMRLPILYALSYPRRCHSVWEPLDLVRVRSLHFEAPPHATFPCLAIAYAALRAGSTMPAVMNAANEIAVEAFLHNQIAFTAIPRIVARVMQRHTLAPTLTIATILAADVWARREASALL